MNDRRKNIIFGLGVKCAVEFSVLITLDGFPQLIFQSFHVSTVSLIQYTNCLNINHKSNRAIESRIVLRRKILFFIDFFYCYRFQIYQFFVNNVEWYNLIVLINFQKPFFARSFLCVWTAIKLCKKLLFMGKWRLNDPLLSVVFSRSWEEFFGDYCFISVLWTH